MQIQNKRKHERRDYNQEILLQINNKFHFTRIENISLGGAFISKKGLPQIKLQDEVLLSIPFKKKGKSVELKGRVARFEGDGAGIEFF